MSNVDNRGLMFQTDGVAVSIGSDFDTISKDNEYSTVDLETFKQNDQLFTFSDGEFKLGDSEKWRVVEREQQIKNIKENFADIIANKDVYMLTDETIAELNDYLDSLDSKKEIPPYPLIYQLAEKYYEENK